MSSYIVTICHAKNFASIIRQERYRPVPDAWNLKNELTMEDEMETIFQLILS